MGEPDPVCLGGEPEQATIGIKREASAGLQELEADLFAAIKQALPDPSIRPKNDVQGVGAEARDLYDLSDAFGSKALEPCAGLDLIKGSQVTSFVGLFMVYVDPRRAEFIASLLNGV